MIFPPFPRFIDFNYAIRTKVSICNQSRSTITSPCVFKMFISNLQYICSLFRFIFEIWYLFALFVCLYGWDFFVLFENFSFICKRHHYLWRVENFNLCLWECLWDWPMISEIFFSMPHTLWHGIYVYNGHCRGPVTLTTVTERLPVDLSLAVLTSRGVGAVDKSVPASRRLSVSRYDSPKLLKQVVTAPLPNAGQQQWVLRVIGNDHYKRMSHVTVAVIR